MGGRSTACKLPYYHFQTLKYKLDQQHHIYNSTNV